MMRPNATPKPLKILILTTIVLSLLSPLVGPYLALSLNGISHLYFWQFITYPLTHIEPISFGLLIQLAFSMYLLWVFGASLIERIKIFPFFIFYLTAVLIGGLGAFGAMFFFNLPYPYAGEAAPLYAVFIAWTMLHSDADLLLFFAIPMKARWLLLGLIGVTLLVALSQRDWIHLFSYLPVFLYGYLFSLIAFRARSSVPLLAPFETTLLKLVETVRHMGKKPTPYRHSKIYDIKSGEPILKDDLFMDAMLARISLYGEATLTPEEKRRMQEISSRKPRGKK